MIITLIWEYISEFESIVSLLFISIWETQSHSDFWYFTFDIFIFLRKSAYRPYCSEILQWCDLVWTYFLLLCQAVSKHFQSRNSNPLDLGRFFFWIISLLSISPLFLPLPHQNPLVRYATSWTGALIFKILFYVYIFDFLVYFKGDFLIFISISSVIFLIISNS